MVVPFTFEKKKIIKNAFKKHCIVRGKERDGESERLTYIYINNGCMR